MRPGARRIERRPFAGFLLCRDEGQQGPIGRRRRDANRGAAADAGAADGLLRGGEIGGRQHEARAAALRQPRQRDFGISPAQPRLWSGKQNRRGPDRTIPRSAPSGSALTSRSIRRARCAASFAGSGETTSACLRRFAPLACFISSGIQTVSRVLCWQAKMRTPPGASAIGHWKTLNLAADRLPSGIVTGRSKSVGPRGS